MAKRLPEKRKITIGRKRFIFLAVAILSVELSGATISGVVQDFVTTAKLLSASVEIICSEVTFHDTVFTNYKGEWSVSIPSSESVQESTLPDRFSVSQNYPNPFNPSTRIGFSVDRSGEVEILVHNLLGQEIGRRRQILSAGKYEIDWRGMGSSGVYFYTIRSAGKSMTRKMVQLDGGHSGGLSEIRSADSSPKKSLKKSAAVQTTIIVSKFGYVSDSLIVEAQDGEKFIVQLKTIHSVSTLMDGHNDIIEKMLNDSSYRWKTRHTYNHTDIPRMTEGGVDIQLFSIWVDPNQFSSGHFQIANHCVEILKTEIAANAENIQQATTIDQALELNHSGKIAGMILVEGGHAIENSLENLKTLYALGMRCMTITWNNSTDWAVSAKAEAQFHQVGGLTEFGKQVIRTMDSLGIVIDVSHVGDSTVADILATTTNPIIASHSGADALRSHYRNLTNAQILAIANTGGVIGVTFYPPFLSSDSRSVNIQTVINHIQHIVDLVGIDHVGIGSDFDGIEVWPTGLEDTSKFPALTLALLERGFSRTDVEKILGGNMMRVFRQVCGE
ncbi:MAG: membrane dipeptidase [Candidatus Neomarinimicrobiota bacterium]